MDELANQLRRDAAKFDVTVSDDLDHRIAASLQNVAPHDSSAELPKSERPLLFWWASTLTGVAAAAAVIIIVNTSRQEPDVGPDPAVFTAAVPEIDWKSETAVFTNPLQQELDALQSDIRKAEEQVRADIGL